MTILDRIFGLPAWLLWLLSPVWIPALLVMCFCPKMMQGIDGRKEIL